jgi:outer membrane protein assembly factor BamB
MGVRGWLYQIASLIGCLTLTAVACNRRSTGVENGDIRQRWYRAQRGESSARPAIAGHLVYFGTGDGKVVARDRNTGNEQWTTTVSNAGAAVRGANLIARSGTVVVPVGGHVVGLDGTTGQERWRFSAPLDTVGNGPQSLPGSVVKTRIDANDDVVLIPAWGASVSAVDLRDGAVRWTWRPGLAPSDTAASGVFRSGSMGVRIGGNTAYATVWHFRDRQGLTSEAWLVALDVVTGRELWRYVQPTYTGGVNVQGAPGFAGNLVIFATVGGRITAIDRTTHNVVWASVPEARFATVTQAEVVDDVVYADGGDERLYALAAATGRVLWSSPTFSASEDLLVTPKAIYHVNGGKIRILSRANGRIVATVGVQNLDDAVESPPAFADGAIFVNVTAAAWSFDEP